MLETAVALLLAHAVADFVLQSDRMVREKHRAPMLLAHGAIVAATAWAALGLPLTAWPILAVTGTHLLVDWLKVRFGGAGFRAFALDQTAHLAVIATVAMVWPNTYAAGLWPEAARLAPPLAHLPMTFAFGAGLVGAVWAGGHAVGALMRGLHLPPDPADDPSLPQGGRLIGQLERLIILVLVLAGEIVGIGLLIAAKSILRFGEAQRSRQTAEYVIVGTLASFAWALVIAIATASAIAALRP
jgi:hypothetical protein